MHTWFSKPQGFGVGLWGKVIDSMKTSHFHSYTTVYDTCLHNYAVIFVTPPRYYVPLWFQLLACIFLFTVDEQGNPDFKSCPRLLTFLSHSVIFHCWHMSGFVIFENFATYRIFSRIPFLNVLFILTTCSYSHSKQFPFPVLFRPFSFCSASA